MSDIFISYAREDESRIAHIVRELEKRNWSVFWDRKIPPGQTWQSYTARALEEATCVLVVWSRSSIASDWVIEEAEEAKNRGILVPLLLEAVMPPLGFRRIQAADLSDWENNSPHQPFQDLVNAVAAKIPAATLPVVVAEPQPPPDRVLNSDPEPVAKRAPEPVLRPRPAETSPSRLPQPKLERLTKAVTRGIWIFKAGQKKSVIAVAAVVLLLLAVAWLSSGKKESVPAVVSPVVALPPVAAEVAPPNFVLIHGGEFTMGSPADKAGHQSDERPHSVRLGDFYMSKYEVTVADFRKFVEATRYSTDSRSLSGQENQPVIYVSWNDAVAYCEWLSRTTGNKYRLPTEAEWEYACRAGTSTPFNTGENLTTLQANYDGNYPYKNNQKGVYREKTVAVDSFAPNAWGLYNMHGNVWEWCSDWYKDSYYDECKSKGTVTNPDNQEKASRRVLRGGSWFGSAEYCRSAYRNDGTPDYRYNDVGFRLVFVP